MRNLTSPGNVAPRRIPGLRWWALALVVALSDQATKHVVHSRLPHEAAVPVTDFLNLVHRWNTGAAFSLLADAGGWQRYFFTILALLVSAALAWMLRTPRPRGEAWGYALILGGALGNATDRIARGYVIDFLDFHWHGWSWPAFNLADVGICMGAAFLVASSFHREREQH